jgi:DnaJ-class molecular chaperone with C-terminal Zn finger domain
MRSSPTCAINIQALLESLSLSSSTIHPNNSTSSSSSFTVESLANRLKEQHDLGPLADDELFIDLARALFACRDRFLSQTDDNVDSSEQEDTSDDDNEYVEGQDRGMYNRASSSSLSFASVDRPTSCYSSCPRMHMENQVEDYDDVDDEEEDASFRSTYETNNHYDDDDFREDMETLHLNSNFAAKTMENDAPLPPEFLRRFDDMGHVDEEQGKNDDHGGNNRHGSHVYDQSNGKTSVNPNKKHGQEEEYNDGLHANDAKAKDDTAKGDPCMFSTVTPTKPPRDTANGKNASCSSFMDESFGEFQSPCSFATAKEALDTHERNIERQPNVNVHANAAAPVAAATATASIPPKEPTKPASAAAATSFVPPPTPASAVDDVDFDDSDLFSPPGPSDSTSRAKSTTTARKETPISNTATGAAAAATSTTTTTTAFDKTPLFCNVTGGHSGKTSEEVESDSVPLSSSSPRSPPNVSRGCHVESSSSTSKCSAGTKLFEEKEEEEEEELKQQQQPNLQKDETQEENVTNMQTQNVQEPSSAFSTYAPTMNVPPPHPLNQPTKPILNAENLVFTVDLSKKSKGKGAKRGSPRVARDRGKKQNIPMASSFVDSSNKTASQFSYASPSPMRTAEGVNHESVSGTGKFVAGVDNYVPEEMDVDSPDAGGVDTRATTNNKHNETNPVYSEGNGGLNGLSFNIGIGGTKTPSRKGVRGHKLPNRYGKVGGSPSGARRNYVQPNPFPFSPPKSEAQIAAEQEQLQRRQEVTRLREMAKTFYTEKKYRESVLGYTKAIIVHTKNFTSMPSPLVRTEDSEILASMYGNRAAGLMMLGAYKACAKDCEKSLRFLADYNPLSLDLKDREKLTSYIKTDGGLTYMTKFFARMGRAQMKAGILDEAESTFDHTIRISNAALACHEKIVKYAVHNNILIPHKMQKMSEKVINQCLTDATLSKTDIVRVREYSKYIQKQGGVRRAVNTSIAQNNNPHLLQYVDKILQITPTDERMQDSKVICLASMKKWRDIINYCEVLGCKNALYDGVFSHDLIECNPHKGVSSASKITQNGLLDALEKGKVNCTAEQAAEVSIRLPNTVVKMYVRALRLEEKYKEGEAVLAALDNLAKATDPIWSPNKKSHKARYHWLATEKEKFRSTMYEKSRGDSLYREGKYKEAAACYARVMTIDSEVSAYSNSNVCEMDTMGGRLHAVLLCNRAACLIGLKRYDEAAKECTAALKIERGYMKAILRRARCYNRLERYEESISEYNRWFFAVKEAKRNPNFSTSDECPFDRAADISDGDLQKVMSELSNVKDRKSAAEHKARQQAEEAQRRAESAYNRQQTQQDWQYHRRWDSFRGSAPNREKKNSPRRRHKSHQESHNHKHSSKFSSSSDNYRRTEIPRASPSSDTVNCHYAVLQLDRSATQVDIRKSYRRMALKYHPDKNQNCEKAANTFRKVQLAYETLSDENSKRKYDMELRLRSHR